MKIKLPRNLSFAIAQNKSLKRGMAIYLYMKAIDEDGGIVVMNDKAQKDAALWLLSTQRTVQNWLAEAQHHGLIQKISDTTYKVLSWNDMRSRFNVLETGFYFIPLGNVKIKDIFLTKFLLEQYKRCKTAYTYKKKDPAIENEIALAMSQLKIEHSDEAIKNIQREDYSTGSRHLTEFQRFALFYANPDFATGSAKLSIMLGYKGKGSLSYQKRRLQQMGMISVTARKITIKADEMPFMTTKAKRETLLGHHQYFIKDKTLNLFLADKIDFYGYANWQNNSLKNDLAPKTTLKNS